MDIEKHLILTGTSNISWKDAVVKTIEEASKTIFNICSVKIIEQKAKISNNKMTEYYVNLDLGFIIDKERTN